MSVKVLVALLTYAQQLLIVKSSGSLINYFSQGIREGSGKDDARRSHLGPSAGRAGHGPCGPAPGVAERPPGSPAQERVAVVAPHDRPVRAPPYRPGGGSRHRAAPDPERFGRRSRPPGVDRREGGRGRGRTGQLRV